MARWFAWLLGKLLEYRTTFCALYLSQDGGHRHGHTRARPTGRITADEYRHRYWTFQYDGRSPADVYRHLLLDIAVWRIWCTSLPGIRFQAIGGAAVGASTQRRGP